MLSHLPYNDNGKHSFKSVREAPNERPPRSMMLMILTACLVVAWSPPPRVRDRLPHTWRIHRPWAPLSLSHHVLTHCNWIIIICFDWLWVDQINAYIYLKRGFYYFSRRVTKEFHSQCGCKRIVIALNIRSRAKALKNPHIYTISI